LYKRNLLPQNSQIKRPMTRPHNPKHTLLPVPHPGDLGMPHLLLQLEDSVHERLGSRRAAGYVDVYWHDPVASSCDRVAVVVVSSSVGAAAHGNNPSWVGHLVVDLSQRWRHLVCEGSGYDHDVGLSGRGTENNTETILIVSWGGQVHHLDGAACETESHGP